MTMYIPNTIGELLALTQPPDDDRHYCETGEEQMVLVINHPLSDMTEPGIDPFIIYVVYRCAICGDWWGNWVFRDITHDKSDWYRFGRDTPTRRHREIPEEEV